MAVPLRYGFIALKIVELLQKFREERYRASEFLNVAETAYMFGRIVGLRVDAMRAVAHNAWFVVPPDRCCVLPNIATGMYERLAERVREYGYLLIYT
jgi:hypothetical protein